MAGLRAVWVTTYDGRRVAVRVEYDDGVTGMVFADQLSMPSPSVPATKVQLANQLKKLSVGPKDIEPDQIILEPTPTKA